MKRIMSLLVIAGLGCMTVGCSGDPGESVEMEITEPEITEMDAVSDVASEAALESK